MKLGIYAAIWLLGALALGCTSQGAHGATLSLQREAERAERDIYDEVELIAGSGAEEDEPADENEPDDETAEPDASIDERIAEAMGWSDDSPLCGNGVLDDGELCDYVILEGEGTCPAACHPAPGCPDETLVVRGCQTHCMAHDEPSDECLEQQ